LADYATLEGFLVRGATGRILTYTYFEDEAQRRMAMKRFTKGEVYRIAGAIIRLLGLLQR
jgi:hypothetical protein